MSLDGIWSSELGGPYGWEPIGTMFLRGGHLTGGGRNHFSVGTYREKDDGAVFHIEIRQFGKKRALFGRKSEQVRVIVKARREGDRIIGEATMPGHIEYALCVRFKRRGDLPEE